MKEEFTTRMHAEFLGDEIPLEDLQVMAVYAQCVKSDISLEEACKNEGISVEYYLANVNRVLN